MRNISASLTKDQIRQSVENARQGLAPVKDVTRRLGWRNLQPGERLQVCEKCQGLKPGEKLVKLCVIEVVESRREPLRRMIDDSDYGNREATREGFLWQTGRAFVQMFCEHMKCTPETEVTRIEFKYVWRVSPNDT